MNALAPIPGPSHAIPLPLPHRHTAPARAMPHHHSFSALGPGPDFPSAPPDGYARHQTPLPPTPEPSPPGIKLLGPTMMIKLAPPAENRSCGFGPGDAGRRSVESASPRSHESSESAAQPSPPTPLPAPGPSPTPARARSGSGGLVAQPMVKSLSSSEKPPRPRSMGPPPRARRSQTSQTSHPTLNPARVAAADPTKPRVNSALRTSSYGPAGLSRASSDAGVAPRASSTGDMNSPNLGGPDGLEAKVVLLGSQGVGKTSLILRYTTRVFSPTPASATIGSSLHTRKLVHAGVRVKLQIWDTAGQERFRSMAPIYYRGAHVCVLVYDTSDMQSFQDVRSWLEELGRTVPKETVIFVVGAKIDLRERREVDFEIAKETIRSWVKPPPPPPPPPAAVLSPPPRSLFRSSTFTSRLDSPSTTPCATPRPASARPHSVVAQSQEPACPAPRSVDSSHPLPAVPFPGRPSTAPEQSPSKEKKKRRHSTKPFPVKINVSVPSHPSLTTSPSRLEFPSLQSPTLPTSATFTEPVGPLLASSSMAGHRSSANRFSISGISEVLGLNRTMSMTGAVSSLSLLAQGSSSPPQSPNPSTHAPNPPTPPRTRIESTPLFPTCDPARNARRKSEEWSRSGWKMGQGPGAAEALAEFGAGIRRKESEELLRFENRSSPSLAAGPAGAKSQAGGRSRASSLGKDPRLVGEGEEEECWGVDVEGVMLGECSALSGQGVEVLFKAISSILVDRRDKIEKERQLRHKNSVMLVDPAGTGPGGDKSKKNAGCCA